MRIVVVAEEPAQFEEWQKAQLKVAQNPPNDVTARGRELFRTETCVNCHAINGVPGANVRVAPDLTHVASRRQLGSGIMPNTPENMRRWITNPQAVKPGALMPDFNLTNEEVDELSEYLSTLR